MLKEILSFFIIQRVVKYRSHMENVGVQKSSPVEGRKTTYEINKLDLASKSKLSILFYL